MLLWSPTQVDNCFIDDNMAKQSCEYAVIRDLTDYVFMNWMNTNTVMFPRKIWTETLSLISRTTNADERLNMYIIIVVT